MEYSKTVKISFAVFMTIIEILNCIDKNSLPENIRPKYDLVYRELYKKRSKIRNRLAYSDIVQAPTDEERDAARDNYHKTKEMSIYL